MDLFCIKYETKDGSRYIHNTEHVNGTGYHQIDNSVMKFNSKTDVASFMKTWSVHPYGHLAQHKVLSFEAIPLPREYWDLNDWKAYALYLESKLGDK